MAKLGLRGIRITRAAGTDFDVPAAIQEQWVGVTLALPDNRCVVEKPGYFVVRATDMVAGLVQEGRTEAATWWTQTLGNQLHPEAMFTFSASDVEVVPLPAEEPVANS